MKPQRAERPLDIGEYMERRYEQDMGEPWSALEARTRARHPELFVLLDSLKEEEVPKKKWWQIWK